MWLNEGLAARMDYKRLVRKDVTEAIEVFRVKKEIGSSLEAHPVVYFAGDAAMLDRVGGLDVFAQDFDEFCITSGIELKSGQPEAVDFVPGSPRHVIFHPAKGQKCERCWRVLPDVGTHKHAGTCARCNDALG